jgi:hypothetical protein
VTRRPLAAVLLAAALAAGCGSSPAPAVHHRAAPSVTYADPACRRILARITAPPGTELAADAEMNSLSGIAAPGSTLAGLTDDVRADLLNISFDDGGLRADTAGDVQEYETDVAQVRSFCKS